MKIIAVVMLFMLFVAGCFGQSALVVPLSTMDAEHAKTLHQAMLDAEKNWVDYQETVRSKYLILDKSDPAAGEDRWYGDVSLAISNVVFSDGTAGSYLTSSGTGWITANTLADETVAQKQAREAKEKKAKEAYAKEEAERDAKAKRWRKGWRDSSAFQFSDDYRFIVPGYANNATSGTLRAVDHTTPPCSLGWGSITPGIITQ